MRIVSEVANGREPLSQAHILRSNDEAAPAPHRVTAMMARSLDHSRTVPPTSRWTIATGPEQDQRIHRQHFGKGGSFSLPVIQSSSVLVITCNSLLTHPRAPFVAVASRAYRHPGD